MAGAERSAAAGRTRSRCPRRRSRGSAPPLRTAVRRSPRRALCRALSARCVRRDSIRTLTARAARAQPRDPSRTLLPLRPRLWAAKCRRARPDAGQMAVCLKSPEVEALLWAYWSRASPSGSGSDLSLDCCSLVGWRWARADWDLQQVGLLLGGSKGPIRDVQFRDGRSTGTRSRVALLRVIDGLSE